MKENNIKENENYQALLNRANKIVNDFAMYPIMPSDIEFAVIEKVFSFNPLFVLNDLKSCIMDVLLEKTDYKYTEEELMPIINETYGKKEKQFKIDIMNRIINNFKADLSREDFIKYSSHTMLIMAESIYFYYAYSIFYIAKDIKSIEGLFAARVALRTLDLFECEKSNSFDGIRGNGKMLDIEDCSRERRIYDRIKNMIDSEINNSNDDGAKQRLREMIEKEQKSQKGCYIATCVYGSYDCPNVWTLRRFRDNTLDQTWHGRVFIKAYYKISPTLVKYFGKTRVFNVFWRNCLDKLVNVLKEKGFEDTPYND